MYIVCMQYLVERLTCENVLSHSHSCTGGGEVKCGG